MIKKQAYRFLIRCIVSIFAMYLCINWFCGFKPGYEWMMGQWWLYVVAGLIFALMNAFVRPIMTILALPMLFLTLGVFTIVLNAAMVGLTIWIIPNVTITFWGAVGGCLVISIFNYLVNLLLPDVK